VNSTLRNSRLLVLGAGQLRHRAFAEWARAGIEVTLVDGFSVARYDTYVDRFLPWDVRDGRVADWGGLLELAKSHDGVTSLSDETLVVTARLAAELGLPGAGPDAAELARDKYRQRIRMHAAGLPAPRFRAVAGPADLAAFRREHPGPVVVKPLSSGGSAGVAAVAAHSPGHEELAAARLVAGDGGCLVEEFVAGAEISVEAVVQAGEVCFIAVTEKETTWPLGFLERQHLVGGARAMTAAAGEAVRRLAAACLVESAVLHAEFFVRDGELVAGEFATRPAGGLIPDLVFEATGRSLYLDQAGLALGRPVEPAEDRGRHAGVRFLYGRGLVERYAAPSEVLAGLPELLLAQQFSPIGARLRPMVANWTRAGAVLGAGPDPDSLGRSLVTAVGRMAQLMGIEESR